MPTPDAVEIFWDDMWVRRVGEHLLPDPEYVPDSDPEWPKWAGKVAKYRKDANDYWFYQYKPKPGDTIVDIGAGRGEDVFVFSESVGEQGKVWAIEPHPVSFAALHKLCQLNALTNVTSLNVACTEVPCQLQIETMPVWESNYIRPGAGTPGSYPVSGTPFDDLAEEQGIGQIDFLKMNIEGAERVALPGCRQALQRTRHVCIAAHDFRANRGEGEQFRTLEFVREFLNEVGFDVVMRSSDPRYYVPYHVHGFRRGA